MKLAEAIKVGLYGKTVQGHAIIDEVVGDVAKEMSNGMPETVPDISTAAQKLQDYANAHIDHMSIALKILLGIDNASAIKNARKDGVECHVKIDVVSETNREGSLSVRLVPFVTFEEVKETLVESASYEERAKAALKAFTSNPEDTSPENCKKALLAMAAERGLPGDIDSIADKYLLHPEEYAPISAVNELSTKPGLLGILVFMWTYNIEMVDCVETTRMKDCSKYMESLGVDNAQVEIISQFIFGKQTHASVFTYSFCAYLLAYVAGHAQYPAQEPTNISKAVSDMRGALQAAFRRGDMPAETFVRYLVGSGNYGLTTKSHSTSELSLSYVAASQNSKKVKFGLRYEG